MTKCKKIAVGLMVVALAAQLVACSGSSQPEGSALGISSVVETAQAQSTENENKFYDENKNLIVPFVDESITYQALYKKNALDVGSMEDKRGSLLGIIEDDLKIHFDFEAVDEAAWEEKLNLVFATGQLPDVIWGDIPGLASHLDQVMDITDLIDSTAWLKNFYEQNPVYLQGESIGGRLYSFSKIQKSSNHS